MKYTEVILSGLKLKLVTPHLRSMIERVQVIPAYEMALICPADQGIWMTVGNMESELSCFVPGEIVTQGDKALLSAESFFEHCRNCPPGENISLRFSESVAHLEYGACKNKLQSLPVDQFPLFSEESEGTTFRVEEKQLKETLLSTLRSMANNDVRPYLNGMVFVMKDNTLQCVSSDGHRLSTGRITAKENGKGSEEKQPVLPRKAVLVLDKIVEEKEKMIEISVYETQVVFRTPDMIYKVKPIEDHYPDFSRTFPGDPVTSVQLNRENFIKGLHQASVICDDKVPVAQFFFSDDQLEITTGNSKEEETNVLLNARLTGDDKKIWFNISYLLDALESLFTENVALAIDKKGALLMTGEDEADYPKHVVMSLNR